MIKIVWVFLIATFTISLVFANATLPGDYYVISSKLNVRLSANKTGKITNTLYKRQKVEVFELQNGWARVSQYYDGAVEGLHRSSYFGTWTLFS